MLQGWRRHGDQSIGQFKSFGVGHLQGWRVIELGELIGDGLRDAWAAMSGIDAPKPGRAIHYFSAILRRVIHTLRAG